MAQVNPVVGDIEGNAALIKNAVAESLESNVDVIVFPEMVLTGYPVEDLALRPAFRRASIDRVTSLAKEIADLGASQILTLVGYLDEKDKPQNALA
ncbi:MAG: NAD+ synthase, partial [Actinobacteria bacterium]|nr:NAD+ synthase [Actinomycetota bacterium]